ncbi:coiled-coil domain-containing protein 39 [Chelonus insularis]|uniref:coiled-coil domain-containing protein 39 n=1 Tax=Chelonus insularis TaxID=460826 RepID=UPI0015888443|nr:coiled-coil domain-containing protein 39 [Chelonus insularis]
MQQETVVDTKSSNTTRLVQLNKFKKGVTALSSSGEKSLVKCINRKPQVPTKCQRKPYIREPCTRFAAKPFSKSAKVFKPKNNYFQVSSYQPAFEVPNTSSCRKSLSMIELSPGTHSNNVDNRSKRSLMLMGQGIPKIPCSTTKSTGGANHDQEHEDVSKKASHLVCHVLILNAWRRRREEVVELQGIIEKSDQQIDHLQLQIVVLRKLLDTENSRVGKLGAEVHRAKTQLDGVIKEKETIHEEKKKLENEFELLKQLSEERRIAVENLKNDLFSTKSQLEALDSQMAKEREKILKLREDKKILLEKVFANEALAKERGERARAAEKTVEELQDKLSIHQGIIESLQEDNLLLNKTITDSETEKMELTQQLLSSAEIEKNLNDKIIHLEIQLSDRETALRRFESIYNSQLIELKEIKEKIIRQSEEMGWSSKFLQIAGNIVRVPRAILRTLSFLAVGGISSHP